MTVIISALEREISIPKHKGATTSNPNFSAIFFRSTILTKKGSQTHPTSLGKVLRKYNYTNNSGSN